MWGVCPCWAAVELQVAGVGVLVADMGCGEGRRVEGGPKGGRKWSSGRECPKKKWLEREAGAQLCPARGFGFTRAAKNRGQKEEPWVLEAS